MLSLHAVAWILWAGALAFLVLFLAVMIGPLVDDLLQRRRRARRGGMLR